VFEFASLYYDNPIVQDRALDIFTPVSVTRDVALLFVHGGGWQGGGRAGYHRIMRAFNAAGFLCGGVDYRLTGATILDQITDVRHGYSLFRAHLKDRLPPGGVVVYGSSAGAHLAALLALTRPGDCGEKKDDCGSDLPEPWVPPTAAVVQSAPVTFEPWEDIFPHIWSSMQRIVGVPYEEDPAAYCRVSPIEHTGDDSCPFLFLEAENEHMFPHSLTQQFRERMRERGRRSERRLYANAEHGFFYDVTRKAQKQAFQDILDFIESL